MRILTIDGGGIRGIIPAYILNQLSKTIDLKETFDFVVGTSTGSILAAAVATGVDINKVYELYKNKGKEIFKKNLFGFKGLLIPKYSSSSLNNELSKLFGNTKMKQISKPHLAIPTCVIKTSQVQIIKSNYIKNYVRDGDRLVSESVLASCSAPSYFNPTKIDKIFCVMVVCGLTILP